MAKRAEIKPKLLESFEAKFRKLKLIDKSKEG